MTKLEFERNMKLLNEDVTPKLRAALHDPAAEPLYVWYNVALQDSAEYPDMGFARKKESPYLHTAQISTNQLSIHGTRSRAKFWPDCTGRATWS